MKKILALILFCLMSVSTVAFAADFSDVEGHWAINAINNAAENGLITGSEGRFYPDDNMTRAEMATIVVRAFGATEDADISEFTDVLPTDWFYASMSKAVAMGAFNGSDGKLNPENSITRQEAFVVLSRVFGLAVNEDIDLAILNQFSDKGMIEDWAEKDVAAIITAGYVGGSDGKLNPTANITRAEFAAVMDRLIKYYIDDETATTLPTDGNIMIRVGGIKVEKLTTDKMLVVGDGVGKGTFGIAEGKIDNSVVIRASETTALGGKYKSIKIIRPGIRVQAPLPDPTKGEKAWVGKDSVYSVTGSFLVDDKENKEATETQKDNEEVKETEEAEKDEQ